MARWMRFLTVAAAIATPFAAALDQSPAAADTPSGAETAVFTAHTTALTPVLWVGGGGSYTLQQDTCLDIPEITPACTVNASGTYVSTVCGTGTVSGTATVGGVDTYTGPFTITFVDGMGAGTATLTDARDGSIDTAAIVAQLSAIVTAPAIGAAGAGVCANALSLAAMLVIAKQAQSPAICVFKSPGKDCQFVATLRAGSAVAGGATANAITLKMKVFDLTAGGGDLCAGQAVATDAQVAAGPFKVACSFAEVVGNRYKVQLTDGPGALNANTDNWLGGGAG
jgi:hypothetical protein